MGINDTKRIAEVERTLASLAKEPEIIAIYQRKEAASVERRKTLRAQLDAAPANGEAERIATGEALAEAEKRVRAAHAELAAANDAHVIAMQRVYGLGHAHSSAVALIERELQDSADPRIVEMIDHCQNLRQVTRHLSFAIRLKADRSYVTGRQQFTIHSNADQIAKIWGEITRVQDEMQALLLEPLTRQDVTERLRVALLELDAQLAEFGLDVLAMDEDGNLISQVGSRKLGDLTQEAQGRIGADLFEKPKTGDQLAEAAQKQRASAR